MMYDWGYGGGIWSGLLMLLFWVLLIGGIVVAVRYMTAGGRLEQGEKPMDILKARYAKGEVTKTEFEQLKKDLQG